MASFFADPAVYSAPLDTLPLVDRILPLPNHRYGCVSDDYATSYDCNILKRSNEFNEMNHVMREIKEFYDEYGYVVLEGLYGADECSRTRDAMWEILEQANPGMNRNDPKSWNSLKSKGKYGLSTRGPSFHPALVENRQNPILIKLLALLTESYSSNDVIVSHDRFTVYRATITSDDETKHNRDFSTGEKNLHLDLSPWWWDEDSPDVIKGLDTLQYDDSQDFVKENNLVVKSMGRHVQCVLNFADNHSEDGGTIVVPYFHRYMTKWCEVHQSMRKNLPWVTLPKDVEQLYMPYAHRISMKEGSVLVWDQRVMHGTCPNRSSRCRLAQYLKAGPRHATYSQRDATGAVKSCDKDFIHPRLFRRTIALRKELANSNSLNSVSPDVGRFVFGFDTLDKIQQTDAE